MKTIIENLSFIIVIMIITITNVYAYGCKSGDIIVKNDPYKTVSTRVFTLTDKNNKTCKVTFSSTYDGENETYEILVDNKKQSSRKTDYTCNNNIKFSLDGKVYSGFTLKNIQCRFDSSSDSFKISGISPSNAYDTTKTCSGDDYLFTKDGKTCKVEITIDLYQNVTLKYGDKNNWSKATKKSNPGISEFDCSIDGTTINIKSDAELAKGKLSKCPNLTADVDSDLDGSDGDHTDGSDSSNVTVIDDSGDYDHGIGDLISKWFGGGNNGNMTAGEMNCNNVIKGTLGQYLTKIFSIMKYLGIVLCVGMTIYEFVKALLDSDKEVMNKLVKKAFTRLILVAVLFFLPLFVNLLVSIFVDNPCPINF